MANIINGTGTKCFAVPMYPRRAPNDDDQKLEGNGGRKIGYHGCSAVIIFRHITSSICIRHCQTAQGVRFHVGEDLLTKATPWNADKLSIKKEQLWLLSDNLFILLWSSLCYGFSILKWCMRLNKMKYIQPIPWHEYNQCLISIGNLISNNY